MSRCLEAQNVRYKDGPETIFSANQMSNVFTDYFQVEATPDTCVDHLKTLVESKLSFAKSDQKLLFKGKTLQGKDRLS